MIIEHLDQLPDPLALPERAQPTRVLMADPAHFDVLEVQNVHMREHVGNVDRERAREQWNALRQAYEDLGFPVDVLPAEAGLPDLVFVANPCFPFHDAEGNPGVIPGRMRSASRQGEVEILRRFFESRGHGVHELPDESLTFEAMGDVLWHPGRRLLYGGHGWRTSRDSLHAVAEIVGAPLVDLELADERFYHLDTCFAPIDERTAVVVPEAFTTTGIALLRRAFPRLIEANEAEAARRFACNGHCPDGRHFLVETGCSVLERQLASHDIEVIPLETSEFRKSGGSVFCMKLTWG